MDSLLGKRGFIPHRPRLADWVCRLFGHKWQHARPHYEWQTELCRRCGVMRVCESCVTHRLHDVFCDMDDLYTDYGGEA